VAAYAFNEGSGTTVADTSGNGNGGAISGATWTSAGKFGAALSFNTSRSSYVSVPAAASLQLTALTVEAWVNPSALSGSWRTVVLKERPGGMSYALYANNGSNQPVGQVYTTAEQNAAGSSSLPLNTWTHLAATYTAGSLKLYVNAVQVAAVSVSGSVVTSSGALKIGGNAIWGEFFNGLIDEVRVYNRALAASEIQADMTTPIGSDTTPPTVPTNLAVSGVTPTSANLTWTGSSDAGGVAGYGIYVGSNQFTSTPATSATVTGLSCATSYTLGVDAVDQSGNRSGRATTSVTTAACDTSPPTVQVTSPAAGATITGPVTLTASATDNAGVAGVQFRVDGQDIGTEDTTPPYSADWSTAGAANGSHSITAVARDTSGNRTTSSPVGVVLQAQPPPAFVSDTPIVGLDQPTQLLFTPDGRMLILERNGTVVVVQPGANQPDSTPFLQLNTVATSDERGALGIALDPNFSSNGFFYVMYTHSSLVNRLSRFTAVGNVASPASERVIWQNDVQAAIYHQGGGLAFGSDGYLYVSVGDNLNRDSAQDLTSFNGKILRIAGDGTVPTNNPFYDGSGPHKDAVWAYGLRNPFRFSFDPPTGRMLIGDVGEGSWEELDVGAAGANYGWPICEGTCGAAGMTNPIFTYPHNGRDASITGGFVYRGGRFGAAYEASYFYADYAQNVLRRLTFDSTGAVSADKPFVPADGSTDGPYGDPVDLREGPDGALYYVDIGALDVAHSGAIRRIRNANANTPPTVKSSADTTSGPAPLTVHFSSAGSSDPEGASLTYAWTFGDGASSTAANPTHTYSTEGTYSARLVVSDGVSSSAAPAMQIVVGRPPTVTITSPASGAVFAAGQKITLSGNASDPRDGPLTGSALTWTVVFHHETHTHPGPGPFTGGTATFTTPTSGHDFTGNTSYEIVLTATDSAGLSSSTSVTIFPRKVNVTYATSPPGLSLVIDSISQTTPYTVDTLVGFHHTLNAPSPQSFGGKNYSFVSWSDGGSATHDSIVPSSDQTLTATFAATAGPPPGLVASYGFEEGSGPTVSDASGKNNTGTLANTTWSSAGKHGSALSFDGTSSVVTVPAASSLDLTSGMTLEAWVNPSAAGGSWRTVVFRERTDGMLYSLYANNGSDRPVGQVFLANAERDAAGTTTVALNTWTHLAATYDGAAVRLYVNGSLVSTTPTTGSLAPSSRALKIGGNSIWGEYYRGLIDDVRVYNRALSGAEITADMAASASQP
jgi:glucose/arabinose dehydrogenase